LRFASEKAEVAAVDRQQ